MAIKDIKDMLNDINKHKRPKEKLLEYFIEYRLNKSIQIYYQQLSNSVDHLALSQDPDKVIIKLSMENF